MNAKISRVSRRTTQERLYANINQCIITMVLDKQRQHKNEVEKEWVVRIVMCKLGEEIFLNYLVSSCKNETRKDQQRSKIK